MMPKSRSSFVHLHVHTEYSMLDGLNRVPRLIEKVKNAGMNAVAITDHGVMYGVYEFWKECKDAGIKPIIGCEIYVSPKERTIRQEIDGIKYYHLLLLAKNFEGYKNLIKIVSIGHLEGFYYRPRVDREILKKYSKGIICTSACPQGPLGKHILRGEPKRAKEWLEFLHNTYKKNFYLELQRHGLFGSDDLPTKATHKTNDDQQEYIKEQSKINKQLKKWSNEYNIPLIATTDAHYLDEEDEFTQEVLFAIKDGKTLNDPSRRKPYKFTYIKTPKEMADVYSDVPEVLENTQKLADSVEEYSILYDRVQPLYLNLKKGRSAKQELTIQAYEGAKRKYGKLTTDLKKRINYEIDIIDHKGYSHYYLVTSDFIKWARKNNIVVSMRGTGAASLVAYVTDITSIDPLWWDLMFERFLNPKRPSPPDFDLDLEDQNRDKVLDYIKSKYGEDCVVAICTFGRLQSRAAIRDVCRVMGIDLQIADVLSKLVQVNFGKPKPVDWMMENNKEFSDVINSDYKLQELVSIVSKIEGMKRHLSTHACGVLITPKPVTEYIPIQREVGGGNRIITQLDLNWIEYAGLMKFDFLGLANLTIIKNATNLIKKLKGVEIDVVNLPLDDAKTFEIFQKGDTTSVFQFEGSGMKKFLRELKPTSIKDICFMAAAYRPGPIRLIPDAIAVKHGKKKPYYLIPELEPILKETYGVIVYQEQIMQIAVDIAGYESMGDADLLRRGVAKKKRDVLKKEEPRFKKGMVENGFTKKQADDLWEYLKPFADYGFPKAHSAMYAVVAYWTAYLKAHYPLEFMCARLTSDMSSPDKLTVSLEEARNLGLTLLPPSINESHAEFVTEGEKTIRYGLNGIKNVGHNVIEEIVKEREINGKFKSLNDFCLRIRSTNSRTMEALIKVGAFNMFGEYNSLLKTYPEIISKALKDIKKREMGQLGFLFSSKKANTDSSVAVSELPSVDPAPVSQKLQWERELLGIYFSAHPIQDVSEKLESKGIRQLTQAGLKDGASVTGVCLISSIKRISTKNGDPMAFLSLEDMHSSVEAVLFPKNYEKLRSLIKKGDVIVVSGRCNMRNHNLSLIINGIEFVDKEGVLENHSGDIDYQNNKTATLVIHESATTNDLAHLKDILLESPGKVPVVLQLVGGRNEVKTFKMKQRVDRHVIEDMVSRFDMVKEVIF